MWKTHFLFDHQNTMKAGAIFHSVLDSLKLRGNGKTSQKHDAATVPTIWQAIKKKVWLGSSCTSWNKTALPWQILNKQLIVQLRSFIRKRSEKDLFVGGWWWRCSCWTDNERPSASSRVPLPVVQLLLLLSGFDISCFVIWLIWTAFRTSFKSRWVTPER